ncbi:unnamed protein product [Gongylonema pulchrum]|uniref:eIF-4F 25 kDa subunit n=1 Tax=Gongylonema pulchrum TaxID=637853 RepID=A0A183DR70_9BILA|nr:unnamed protein product [Gongylonema pulchrum]
MAIAVPVAERSTPDSEHCNGVITPPPDDEAEDFYSWTLWYLNDQRDKSWEKRLKMVETFSTVEEFWALYLNIKTPSMLPSACDYNVFKKDIQPMWEVPENSKGGRWLVTIDKSRHHELLDLIWLEVLLAVIGEQFGEYTKDICGVVVNIRNKGSKVSITSVIESFRDNPTMFWHFYSSFE